MSPKIDHEAGIYVVRRATPVKAPAADRATVAPLVLRRRLQLLSRLAVAVCLALSLHSSGTGWGLAITVGLLAVLAGTMIGNRILLRRAAKNGLATREWITVIRLARAARGGDKAQFDQLALRLTRKVDERVLSGYAVIFLNLLIAHRLGPRPTAQDLDELAVLLYPRWHAVINRQPEALHEVLVDACNFRRTGLPSPEWESYRAVIAAVGACADGLTSQQRAYRSHVVRLYGELASQPSPSAVPASASATSAQSPTSNAQVEPLSLRQHLVQEAERGHPPVFVPSRADPLTELDRIFAGAELFSLDVNKTMPADELTPYYQMTAERVHTQEGKPEVFACFWNPVPAGQDPITGFHAIPDSSEFGSTVPLTMPADERTAALLLLVTSDFVHLSASREQDPPLVRGAVNGPDENYEYVVLDRTII